MTIEERLTVCNMSIEGGARCGYVNPDEATIAYLRGPPVRAAGRGLRARGGGLARDRERPRTPRYADRVEIDGAAPRAVRHLGHQPGPERRRRRAPAQARPRRQRPARLARGGLRLHGSDARRADRGHADRRRLHRLLHERPHLGSARGGARRAHGPGRAARARARRAGLAGRRAAGRGRRGSTRCSARRASSGARPAARCASR